MIYSIKVTLFQAFYFKYCLIKKSLLVYKYSVKNGNKKLKKYILLRRYVINYLKRWAMPTFKKKKRKKRIYRGFINMYSRYIYRVIVYRVYRYIIHI